MNAAQRHRGASRAGFAVVAVLWIVGALAALAGIYAAYIVNTTQAFAANDDRIRADAAISAGLALSAYELNTPKGQHAPTHGHFGFRLDRAHVTVHFINEAARIDLNAAPPALLTGLFVALGVPTEQAKDYADRVVTWRTPPAPGKTDDEVSPYRAAGLSYDPRQAPFASTAELWLVRGLPPHLVARALPYVTVFSGRAGIDLRDAAPMVVAAVPGMTPDRVAAVLRQRQAAPRDEKALLALLGPLQTTAAAKPVKATRVFVLVHFDNGRKVTAEAVIRVPGDTGAPYSVLSWRDDLDGPLHSEREALASR